MLGKSSLLPSTMAELQTQYEIVGWDGVSDPLDWPQTPHTVRRQTPHTVRRQTPHTVRRERSGTRRDLTIIIIETDIIIKSAR